MKSSVDNPFTGLTHNAGTLNCGMDAVEAEIAAIDYALMSLIEQGDQQAMAQIYDTYSRTVYAVALRILKDPYAAEDVLQDVFLRIWRRPSGFLPTGASLGAWFGVTARNRAIDVLRKRRPMDSVDNVPLYARNNVAKEVEHTVMVQHARRLMDALPDSQREAIGLAFLEGLTHAEIARALEAPLGTIKTNIRKALQQLGTAIQNEVAA